MVEPALLNQGWHLSKEGLERCKNGVPNSRVESIVCKALDIDLRHIGLAAIPTDIIKGKEDKIQGPMVLQIQKIRNISAPKANEDSGAAPPLLRLQLTDGHATIMALVLSDIPKIGLSMPPGSKLKIKGSVAYNHGFVLLMANNCTHLGGNVEELVQRWQLAKSLYHHTRRAVSGRGGPPPWVPFGQGNKLADVRQESAKITMKKSLEDPKPKEQTEQDKEFAEQRKAAIQEVNKNKQGQGKTFGGTKTANTSKMKEGREPARRDGREPVRRGFEEDRRDSRRNSRRGDQVDGQSTAVKPRSDGIYRDLDYGGYQPSEMSVQQLISMGFKRDAASNALRKHNGNADAAVEMLLNESGPSQPQPQPFGRQRQDARPERNHGNMRRGRRGDDEDEASAPPAAPATLFDFLQPKLGKDKEKGPLASAEAAACKNAGRPRNYAKEQPSSVREAGISFVHEGGKGQSSNYKKSEQQQGYQQKDYSTRQSTGNYDQKSGSDRGDYNTRNYAGNDGRVRNQDRGYGNKENSCYRDRNTNRDRRDDNRQGDNYPQRKDIARGEDRLNNDVRRNYDGRGYRRDAGSHDRERSERKTDYKPRDYQDSRPPRFQKQNDSQNKNTNPVSQRKEQQDDRSKMSRDSGGNQPGGNQPGGNPLQTPQSANHFAGAGVAQMQQRPNLKPGDLCQAKYWEDKQFYNAVLTAVHPSGNTCVVLFPEYGNHEEVRMTDIRPLPTQAWNPSQVPPGPSVPSLLTSGKGGMFEGSMNAHLEFRQGGEGTAYNRPRQQGDQQKYKTRPSQDLYQPPTSRK